MLKDYRSKMGLRFEVYSIRWHLCNENEEV